MSEKQLIIYETKNGKLDLQLDLDNETLWLDRDSIAKLYNIDRTGVSRHINNILSDNEVDKETNVKKISMLNSVRQIELFSLDIILAVGYRTNSSIAINLRKWVTQVIKEYMIKGFSINSERLKNPNKWDYFDELLEKIREIRASEKRFYQKIKDLFALSQDYDPKNNDIQLFFAEVQNKMLYAVIQKTAAEIIIERADETKPNMNLQTWEKSRVRKTDVIIAKNYLVESEVKELERLVTMFLDYAENQAMKKIALKIDDWKEKVDTFLNFNEYNVLKTHGSVSIQEAKKIAEQKYKIFNNARKKAEAEEADKQDMLELEAVTKEIKQKK